MSSLDTLRAMLRCCESWEPDVCIMGNVRSADAAKALRDALAEAEKAEPVAWQERTYSEEDKAWGNWYHIDNESLLIRKRYPRPWVELRPLFAHPPAALPDDEVLWECEENDGRRVWWSGGTWLYPGDTVVVRRAAARGKG